jgi:lipopolysaccharide transport system permease protein
MANLTVIEPARGLGFPDLRELWEHRDLTYFLVRRDLAIRYKQSIVGVLWAVLQPVLLAAVFSVFLGVLAKVPSESGVPYPVFALSGLVMWIYFATAVSRAADSTVASSDLISKVYFPRAVIPVAAVLAPTVDFLFAFVVLIGALLVYGIPLQSELLLVPLLVPVALGIALGAGLWLSALHVKYRDVNILVPFLVQVGLFITPVIYSFDLVPDNLKPLYAINPLVGLLETFRWMLFPETGFPGAIMLIPLAAGIILLVSGALYFRRSEQSFADVI